MFVLFTAAIGNMWRVEWQEHDGADKQIGEGYVSGTVSSRRSDTIADFFEIHDFLQVAQVDVKSVGGSLQVRATRLAIERAIWRRLRDVE